MVEITYLEFYNSFEPPDQNKGVRSIDQQRFLFQGYVCTIRGKVDFMKDGHPLVLLLILLSLSGFLICNFFKVFFFISFVKTFYERFFICDHKVKICVCVLVCMLLECIFIVT